jgi:hypothetical protein
LKVALNTINQPTRHLVSVRILTLISKVDVHNVKLIQLPVNQILSTTTLRRVLRYQRVNQNRRRTDNTMTKAKVQKGKQRPTKHTHKTKDRVT